MIRTCRELANAEWRESSLSGGDGGDRAEAADPCGGRTAVRDGKNPSGRWCSPGANGRPSPAV
ncbi:DUF397 domain-containing protein [Streptosporangium sp. NPDC002721]|uniref:DUF397 domain-containing protein n=1 Tax=Streptosporangium sp. NPDC002721 TaxID=3366188 RepID=UPI0036795FE7